VPSEPTGVMLNHHRIRNSVMYTVRRCGHVARMGKTRNAYRIVMEKPL
jgi:hypothetical protein